MADSFNDRINILLDLIIESTKEFNRLLEASRAEFDQRMREQEEERKKFREEFQRGLEASRAEFDQRMREQEEERKKFREEFQRGLEASREKLDRDPEDSRRQSEREMAEFRRAVGGIDNAEDESDEDLFWRNAQAEIAEDLFRRSVQAALESLGMHMDSVFYNLKAPGVRQYDVTAVNSTQVVVFEIKNKLRRDDITRFLETHLPQFKEAFPQFKDHKVYGGVGALVMSREQEAEAVAQGLFVLTQGEDGVAHIQGPKTPIIL